MTFIIILSLLVASSYMFLTFSKKNSTLKRQVVFLSRQNDSLRKKLAENDIKKIPTVIYHIPEYKHGIITKDTNMNLAPLDGLLKISTLKENTKVYILDSAEINNTSWFHITLNSNDNINNKGWIKQDCITLIKENIYN